MHGIVFLQDMAVVMIAAGLVTVLFHRLRQPVVLGYILAGMLIGPHMPPYHLVQDRPTIDVLAELGVILLMFGLGLHFSLRDLARVGATAFVAATLEILSMLALGYGVGRMFGWAKLDSLFLGAILSISSTTIIIKALQDLRLTKEPFAALIFGILIVEDILAIAMLALLPGVATTGSLSVAQLVATLGKLAIFLTVVLVFGLIAVPRALRYIARFKSAEMLLVSALALCFGTALLADKLGYSVALGAFLIGAVVAEARERGRIEALVAPVRDMFLALYFVAIGMLIEPRLLVQYAVPIAVITVVVVVGKVVTCSVGTFVTGHAPKTSLKVGMGKVPIGEFSFVIASLGLSMRVISDFLYPVAVMVSATTTLLTPYLIREADGVADWLGRQAPRGLTTYLRSYGGWFAHRGRDAGEGSGGAGGVAGGARGGAGLLFAAPVRRMLKRWGIITGLNLALITGLFIAAPIVAQAIERRVPVLPDWTGGVRGVVWFVATAAALPLLVVTLQKLRAGSMLVAELWATAPATAGFASTSMRGQSVVAQTLFVVGTTVLALWILLLSLAVIPPWPVAVVLGAVLCALVAWRWRKYAQLYSRAESALHRTFAESAAAAGAGAAGTGGAEEEARALPPVLQKAELAVVVIGVGSPAAGRLIRELELRTRSGASVVAIERAGASIINPGPDEEILAGDEVLLIGSAEHIASGRVVLAGAANGML